MNTTTILDDVNGTTCSGTCQRSVITPTVLLIYNSYLSLSLILGIMGNGLVLIVFGKYKAATSTDWFIIFITIFDFISSVVNVPIYLTFSTGYWRNYGNDLICKLHMFISQSVALSSTFLICGLSVERYLKICRRTGRQLNKFKALLVCIGITCVTTLLSAPCFEMYRNIRGQCTANALEQGVFLYYVMVLFTYIVAFVVVTVSYTKISIAVLKSEKNVSRHTNIEGSRTQTWCCFKVSKNRVMPSTFQTNTSTEVTNQDEKQKEIKNDDAFNNKVAEPTKFTQPDNVTSNVLRVPQTPIDTQISTITLTNESNISGTSGNSPQTATIKQNSKSGVPIKRLISSQGKKTTRITFAVCLIFILSWLPPWIAFLLYSVPEIKFTQTVIVYGLFGRMTYLLNTFMNPILYLCLNRKFRERASALLCFWKKN